MDWARRSAIADELGTGDSKTDDGGTGVGPANRCEASRSEASRSEATSGCRQSDCGQGGCRPNGRRPCVSAAGRCRGTARSARVRRPGASFERLEARWALAGDMTGELPMLSAPADDMSSLDARMEEAPDAPAGGLSADEVSSDGGLELGNHAPLARDDQATTLEDQAIWLDVLANDSDPDDDLALDTLRILDPPRFGLATVDAVSGNIRYEPTADYFGADSFSYGIADHCGNWAVASVAIEVSAVPDALADLQIVAGVNATQGNLPRSSAGDRLELTQGDTVRFAAVAASSDGFAPDEPIWIVTVGDRVQRTTGVPALDVTFDRFAPRGKTTVVVATPSTGEQFVTTIDVVPYPVSLGALRYGQDPPSKWVTTHSMYGTEYFRPAVPSLGAPVDALREFVDSGDLQILKEVKFAPSLLGVPPVDSTTERGITWTGEVDDDARIHMSYFSLGTAASRGPLGADSSYQADTRWYWTSNAADSVRNGQPVELATGRMSHSLETSGFGFQVVSKNESLAMRQPYVGLSPWAPLTVTPNPIPVGDFALAEITGTAPITRADAVAGVKSFDIVIYDEDPGVDDALQTVRVTLSLPNAVANQFTPFRVVVPVFNRNGLVGLDASSWEREAELYWEAAALGLTSPVEIVAAESP